MRRLLIAGNWKMNLGPKAAVQLLEKFTLYPLNTLTKTDILVIPPFVSLTAAERVLKDTNVYLGAQNLHHENSGAYTGEISASMLKEAGCSYVLSGHSERRTYSGETNQLVLQKVRQAITSGLHAILCVGENLDQRNERIHKHIVMQQVESVVSELSNEHASALSIAYEPVWAVGTGETATPQQAQEMHQLIRERVRTLWGEPEAKSISIIYGGSMKPENAGALLRQPDVDGGLIGGASLKADQFFKLVEIAENVNN